MPLRRAPASSSRESLPKRTDFSPYVAVAGQDKPALSVDDQQICVEGLKHGESYSISCARACPRRSARTCSRPPTSASMCATGAPSCRLAGKAYVLPKTGQQGIPLVSVNTDTIKVTIYRIGDRNLIDNGARRRLRTQSLRLHARTTSPSRRARRCGPASMKVEKELNQEITTNFPVNEAVPALQPGVYRARRRAGQCAQPRNTASAPPNGSSSPTSGSPPIPALTASMPSSTRSPPRRPSAGVELRLIARNNEVLATKTTDADGARRLRAWACRAAKADLAPALLVASRRLRRLRLPEPQVLALRPHRPRRRRPRRSDRPRCLSCSPSAASIAPARPCM